MNGNIIVNVGDLVLGCYTGWALSGSDSGSGARQGKTRRGKGGQDWARQDDPGWTEFGGGRWPIVGAVRGRDQDRDSIWNEIEEEIADVSCFVPLIVIVVRLLFYLSFPFLLNPKCLPCTILPPPFHIPPFQSIPPTAFLPSLHSPFPVSSSPPFEIPARTSLISPLPLLPHSPTNLQRSNPLRPDQPVRVLLLHSLHQIFRMRP